MKHRLAPALLLGAFVLLAAAAQAASPPGTPPVVNVQSPPGVTVH